MNYQCAKCQALLQPGSKQCAACGMIFEQPTPGVPAAPVTPSWVQPQALQTMSAPPPQPPIEANQERAGGNKRVMIGVGAAIALAAIVFIVLFNITGGVPTKQADTTDVQAPALAANPDAAPAPAAPQPAPADPNTGPLVAHADPNHPGMRYYTGDLSSLGPPPVPAKQAAPVQQVASAPPPAAASVQQAPSPVQAPLADIQPAQQSAAPQTQTVILAVVGPEDRSAEVACEEFGYNLTDYRRLKQQVLSMGIDNSDAPHYISFLADVTVKSGAKFSTVISVANALVADDGLREGVRETRWLAYYSTDGGGGAFDFALRAAQNHSISPEEIKELDQSEISVAKPNFNQDCFRLNGIMLNLARGRA